MSGLEVTNNFVFKKNDQICVIRMFLDNESLSWLQQFILNNNRNDLKEHSSLVSYYKNIGNDREILRVYKENLQSKNRFDKNKGYFIQSSKEDFDKVPVHCRRFVFEIIYGGTELNKSNNDSNSVLDISNLQYLILILSYLSYKNEQYNILISGGKYNRLRYTSLKYEDFGARARTFLQLYGVEDSDSLNIILQQIRIYIKYKVDKKEEEQWQRLIDINKNLELEPIGKIFPLIPINAETFKALTSEINSLNKWERYFQTLCNDYLKLYSKKQKKDNEFLKSITVSDTYLEKLLYFSMVAYVSDYEADILDENIILLHEICNDYAQGVAQLIENSLIHAVLRKDNTVKGGASFSIRIREKADAWYIKSQHDFENVARFMEIYVTDLQYEQSQFKAIVDKFVSNVEERLNNIQKTDPESEICKISANLIGASDKIKLQHLFGIGENNELLDYLSNPENIAYHYGLQILSNVVTTGDGYLYVRSKDEYSNQALSSQYFKQNFDWEQGTAYIIYLPIKLTPKINYNDSIAVNNIDFSDTCKAEQIDVDWDKFLVTDKYTKDEIVRDLKENILYKSQNLVADYSLIAYIDCSECCIQYEILAKSIFLCFAESDKFVNNIALINIKDRHEVIKLFRQFALFYNREGKNKSMLNKSVFIVDAEAQIDLLLQDSISSIKENMRIGQIYGGVDSIAINIINHLSNRH